MTERVLTERFAYSGGTVDRSGPRPVVRGVLLCGPTSANRRRYHKEAFAGDQVKKYDQAPVFFNHGSAHAPRGYESRIGKVINPRLRADGMPVGDIEVRPKHPFAPTFLDDVEHDPGCIGMSHVAKCRTEPGAGGWEDVRAVESVLSVDVVLDPATTKSLFESLRSRAVSQISLKTFAEQFGPKLGPDPWKNLLKVCREMGELAADPVIDAPPADGDLAPADLKQSLMDALTPLLSDAFDTGNPDKIISAVKDFVKLHAKHAGGGDTDTDADGGGADDDVTTPESRAEIYLGFIRECRTAGFTSFTEVDLKAMRHLDAQERAEFIATRRSAATWEAPVSAGRGAGKLTRESKQEPARITWQD